MAEAVLLNSAMSRVLLSHGQDSWEKGTKRRDTGEAQELRQSNAAKQRAPWRSPPLTQRHSDNQESAHTKENSEDGEVSIKAQNASSGRLPRRDLSDTHPAARKPAGLAETRGDRKRSHMLHQNQTRGSTQK